MLISFQCATCQSPHQAEARLAGRQLRCCVCGALFVVPSASTVSPVPVMPARALTAPPPSPIAAAIVPATVVPAAMVASAALAAPQGAAGDALTATHADQTVSMAPRPASDLSDDALDFDLPHHKPSARSAPEAPVTPLFDPTYDAAAAAYDFGHPSGTDPLLEELGLLDEPTA